MKSLSEQVAEAPVCWTVIGGSALMLMTQVARWALRLRGIELWCAAMLLAAWRGA